MLTNNHIIKKIKVALKLDEKSIAEIFELQGFEISKSQLCGMFVSERHKNFRECSDAVLKIFLDGLITYYRGLN